VELPANSRRSRVPISNAGRSSSATRKFSPIELRRGDRGSGSCRYGRTPGAGATEGIAPLPVKAGSAGSGVGSAANAAADKSIVRAAAATAIGRYFDVGERAMARSRSDSHERAGRRPVRPSAASRDARKTLRGTRDYRIRRCAKLLVRSNCAAVKAPLLRVSMSPHS